jgi:hypothetical protein
VDSDPDFADEVTMGKSLKNRQEMYGPATFIAEP